MVNKVLSSMVIMLTFHAYVIHVYVRTYTARVYWTTLIFLTRFYSFFLFLLPCTVVLQNRKTR